MDPEQTPTEKPAPRSFGDELRAALNSGSAPEPDVPVTDEVDGGEAQVSEPAELSGEQDADAAIEPETQAVEAPSHWSETDRATFMSLPTEAQQMLLAVEKNMQAGFTRKTEALAQQRRAYERFDNYVNTLARSQGVSREQVQSALVQQIPTLVQYATQLANNPVETLMYLAEQYKVADKLSEQLSSLAYEDEQTRELRQRTLRLSEENQRLKQATQSVETEQAERFIQEFAEAKDEAGNPQHPYFDELRGTMYRLMQIDESLTLDSAYDKALRLDKPDVVLEKERQRWAEAERQRRLKETSKARKNARPTVGKAGKPAAEEKPAPGSLRDALRSNWLEQEQREEA